MKKIARAFSRIIYHLLRVLLRVLDASVPRLYMRLYTQVLKAYGVKFTGEPRYISTQAKFDDFSRVTIGERVVISEKVILLTHDYSVTTAFIAVNNTPKTDIAFIKPIVIKNNVFIGMNSLLLPGTVINDNVIIGAGSVVRGVIPADSIVVGNPAKVVAKLSEKAHTWAQHVNMSEVRID